MVNKLITSCCIAALLVATHTKTQQTSGVGGSGPQKVLKTVRDCKANSKGATVSRLRATIPLNADAEESRNASYESTANGHDYDGSSGGRDDVSLRRIRAGVPADLGWAFMDQAVPIINIGDGTVTWEALFYNRSADRDRTAALEMSYSSLAVLER